MSRSAYNKTSMLLARRAVATAALRPALAPSVASAARNAYVTNDGSDSVSVIDTATNRVEGEPIPVRSPFAIAITPDGRPPTSQLGSNDVSVIDTQPTGWRPNRSRSAEPIAHRDHPRRQPRLRRQHGSGTVSVIDTADQPVVGRTDHGRR